MPSSMPAAGEPRSDAADTARVVRLAALQPQRWANGRGWTREIHRAAAVDAPETSMWRLSLADIEETGPFSSLPGMERHLMSAAPVPLQLTVDGTAHDLNYTRVLSFAGDAEVATTAVQGRAQALNLMARSGTRSSLSLFRGDGPLSVSAVTDTAVVVLDGTVAFDSLRLERFDTVLTGTGETQLDLRDATLARVRVEVPAR